jgi:hypothetical protein
MSSVSDGAIRRKSLEEVGAAPPACRRRPQNRRLGKVTENGAREKLVRSTRDFYNPPARPYLFRTAATHLLRDELHVLTLGV